MRISDWSSDVCSSDLNAACLRWLSPALRIGRTRMGSLHVRQVIAALVGDRQDEGASLVTRGLFGEGCLRCGSGGLYVCDGCAASSARFPSLDRLGHPFHRSEEHTSELQSLMRISYA